MPEARLSISVPEEVWIHDVSTTHPDTTFRVITALAGERTGIALVELQTLDLLSIVAALDSRQDVVDVELLRKQDTEALLQVEMTSPPLLVPVWKAGVPIETPFTVEDGEATWTLTTSSKRFSEFGEYLDEVGIEYDVQYVREIGDHRADRTLTDRQQEVLLTALQSGYYATPREATLTEVASELGVSKSTCSDVLHRAEGKIVTWFAEEHSTDEVAG